MNRRTFIRSQRPIVVIGSVNTDLIMQVPRLPSPGETVRAAVFTTMNGGKGANLSVAAARLGARVVLIGAVGDDNEGREALTELRSEGIDVSRIQIPQGSTGRAMVFVDPDGENIIGVDGGANDSLSPSRVEDALRDPRLHDAVIVANLEVPLSSVLAAARIASTAGQTFVLNAAPPIELDEGLLAACSVLVANMHEVHHLGYDSPPALLAAGPRALVITRGPAGADLLRERLPVLHQDAFPVASVDSTGAGDAFCAALTCAIAAGESLPDAMRIAAAAGALATRAVGARSSYGTMSEVELLVKRNDIGMQHIPESAETGLSP